MGQQSNVPNPLDSSQNNNTDIVGPASRPKKTWLIVLITAVVILAFGGGVFAWQKWFKAVPSPSGQACSRDVKQCPDGSYVGRTGPNCEFAPCPSLIVSPSASPDATADWQTYWSEKYGFEVKYPQNWFKRECGSEYTGFSYSIEKLPICFSDSGQPHINIKISGNQISLEKHINDTSGALVSSVKSIIQIGGISATKISGTAKKIEGPGVAEGTQEIHIIFSHDNNIYQIYYYGLDNKDYSGIFDQILSTFKFTK